MSLDMLVGVVLVLVGVLAVVGLGLLGAAAYAMRRYRVPARGVAAAIAAIAYLVSPVDVVPEALFGPFGLVDDGGVLLAAGVYLLRLLADRRVAVLDGAVPDARGRGHHRVIDSEVVGRGGRA